MTLVINKIIEGQIYVHSDTRVTQLFNGEFLRKEPPLSGILKSIIITPEICISFAGNIDHAHSALEKIFSDQIFDLSHLKILLLCVHVEENEEIDFSIATTLGGGQLIQIKDGEIKENLQVVWLGEKSAFESYQGRYLDGLKGLENLGADELSKLTNDAFEQTLHSEVTQTQSVGDYHISIRTKDDELRYQMKFKIDIGPQEIKIEKPGEWTDIPLGNAENGSYGESYLVSETTGKPAIGIHFIHGNFGILFFPGISRNAILIKGVKWGNEFTARVLEEYGVRLGGIIHVEKKDVKRLREHLELGDKLARQGDYEAAFKFYEKALKIREAPEVLANRGISYAETGEHALAISDFSRAIELGFENEQIYRLKGISHGLKANAEKSFEELRLAQQCFLKCMEIDATSEAAKYLSRFSEDILQKINNTSHSN